MDNVTMTRKRPIGVGIIAALVAIGGIITLIAALYWFFGVGLFRVVPFPVTGGSIGGLGQPDRGPHGTVHARRPQLQNR